MISYREAFQKVLKRRMSLGDESVPLTEATNRVLAEDIYADRDFPPFNRATMDGIAINYEAIEQGINSFKTEAVIAAGTPGTILKDKFNCVEIMTGALVPENADTIVRYEDLEQENDRVVLKSIPVKCQNIHYQGSDVKKGTLILKAPLKISPADIGVLASVGKASVKVKKLPDVAVISTGNELVEVYENPEPHQIRRSNTLTLESALTQEGISASSLHFYDDKENIRKQLKQALKVNDVLILSGGVSKGKFDFVPEIMEELGVEKDFHFVAQKPGKPFWFGKSEKYNTVVFSFPGNPVSTFINYHLYFRNWLNTTLDLATEQYHAILDEDLEISGILTRFIPVKSVFREGALMAASTLENGSGDLISLTKSNGFLVLEPSENIYKKGTIATFIPTSRII